MEKELVKQIKALIIFSLVWAIGLYNYRRVWSGIVFVFHTISPFLIGGAIAFILNVPMSFLEKMFFKNRKWSFLSTLVLAVGILGLICYIVIPELSQTLIFLSKSSEKIYPILEKGIQLMREGGLLGSTYQIAKSLVSGVVRFFVGFIFACYILLQKERLGRQTRKLAYAFLPMDWTDILFALCRKASQVFSSFLTGQFLEALILGGMFCASLLLLKIPYALLISIVIAVTALLPLIGSFVGCIFGTALILTVNPAKSVFFVILFLVIQQIEGNLIYPRVVGKSVGLPAIWVLFSVGVGAALWGVWGVIAFIPISSLVYSFLKGIVNRRLKRRGIRID